MNYHMKTMSASFTLLRKMYIGSPNMQAVTSRFSAVVLVALSRVQGNIAKQIMEEIYKASKPDKIAAKLQMSEFDDMVEDAERYLASVAVDGGERALKQVGVDDEVIAEAMRSDARAWAKKRAAEMIGKRWKDGILIDNPNARWRIDETTRAGIRSLVDQAIDSGWSAQQMAEKIQESYLFSKSRAQMIARTEIGNADTAGTMEGYRASGIVTHKQWLTAEDDLVSPECRMNGEAGPIPFDSVFPGGVSAPLQHPNCRCALLPILKGEVL